MVPAHPRQPLTSVWIFLRNVNLSPSFLPFPIPHYSPSTIHIIHITSTPIPKSSIPPSPSIPTTHNNSLTSLQSDYFNHINHIHSHPTTAQQPRISNSAIGNCSCETLQIFPTLHHSQQSTPQSTIHNLNSKFRNHRSRHSLQSLSSLTLYPLPSHSALNSPRAAA